jgi:acyl-CoA thioesterase-2
VAGFRGVFELQAADVNRFEGNPANEGGTRVYGGHTLTQALLASFRTLAGDWQCYCLHAQFCRIGRPDQSISYAVDRSSESRNFSVRRITATQSGKTLLTMTASFQRAYAGLDFQSLRPPECASPETLISEYHRFGVIVERLKVRGRAVQHLPSGIDGRWADPQDFESPVRKSAENHVWLRALEVIGEDANSRQLALAYCSDFAFFEAALRPHGFSAVQPESLLSGTMDHSIWFHRATDMSQWHLLVSQCVSTHAGLGFVRGEIFDGQGLAVASLAQTGVLRDEFNPRPSP